MRRLWAWSALPAIVCASTGGSAAAETWDYVVKKDGELCDAIAAKQITGSAPDAIKLEILHYYNPQLGPLPHKLKAGQILKLPKVGPDAKVSAVFKKVEAATPAPHPATKNESLYRGHKVSTLAESSAEVTFTDETRLQLAEHTLVVILGGTSSKAAAGKTDTTLMKGTLHGFLSGLGPKVPPAPIATPSAKVVGTSGTEIKLHVDDKQNTTLAVYKGSTQFSAAGKTVAVNAGFGSKAVMGKPPTPPRKLPLAPEWQASLPPLVLSLEDAVGVSATYAPGKGDGPAPAKWHVQLARDVRFNDVVIDVEVPADVVKLEGKNLISGEYFARVAAIDAEKFHGPFGATSALRVATVKVARGAAGKLATADVGSVASGLQCGLDGAALAAVSAPFTLPPARPHTLRCALDAAAKPLEVAIAAAEVGPVLVQSELGAIASTPDGAKRTITLKPTDAVGAAVGKVKLELTADKGITVGAPSERPDGTFLVEVSWKRGQAPAKLHWVINGVEKDDVTIDNVDPALPPPPPAPERVGPHFELGVLGVGSGGLHDIGFGLGGGLDATVTTGAFGGLAFGGVRGTFESYTSGATKQAPTHSYSIDASLITVGLPLGYRLFGPKSMWTPYALVLPQLLFASSTKTDEIVGETKEHSTRLGVATSLGVQLDFGKVGAFVEAGYRFAQAHQRAMGTTALDGPTGALGIRWKF